MKQLGKLLIEEGMVDQAQLDRALETQQRTGGKLGATLISLGFLTEEALYYFLAIQLGMEYVVATELPPEIIRQISAAQANKFGVVPFRRDDSALTLLSPDPTDPRYLNLHDEFQLPKNVEVRFCVSTESGVRNLLGRYYPVSASSGDGSAVK